jgi:polygalacturonase
MSKSMKYLTILAAIAFLPINNVFPQSLLELQSQGWQQVDQILKRIKAPVFKEQEFLVTEYGLTGNSETDNRQALGQLIDLVSSRGGGTIRFPEGSYFFDGPIHLKNDIRLHLDKNALIFFSSNAASYLPAVKVRWEGTVCYNYSPLIYGFQIKNIAITGEGTIDGAALEWSKTGERSRTRIRMS